VVALDAAVVALDGGGWMNACVAEQKRPERLSGGVSVVGI
jgi:hypothetical protein